MNTIIFQQYGPPEVLQLKETTKPAPKENEVLIKVMARTGTVADLRARGFNVPRSVWLPARLSLGFQSPKKKTLGMELSGVIEAVDTEVTRFKRGDQVVAATWLSFGRMLNIFACQKMPQSRINQPE